jgi:site-specific DNA-cytosine methylase
MFFVAHKCAFNPRAPSTPGKTAGEVLKAIEGDISPFKKIADAHKRLVVKLKPYKEAKLLDVYNDMVKSGEIVEQTRTVSTGKQYRVGRPPFLSWRIAFDKPMRTSGGTPNFIHPWKMRYLSTFETQLLCGYPEDYEFVGSMIDVYAQISKAVTPPAGRWIAGEVKRALLADKPRKNRGLRLVDFIKNPDGNDF